MITLGRMMKIGIYTMVYITPFHLYLTFLLEITEDNIEKEKEHYKAVDEIENELKEVDPFYYEKHNEQKTCLTKEDFFLEMSVDLIRCPELLFQPSMVGVEQVFLY